MGSGSGLSEEPALGCELVALESESLPVCPPGPPLESFRRKAFTHRALGLAGGGVPAAPESGSVLAGVKAVALRVAFGQP